MAERRGYFYSIAIIISLLFTVQAWAQMNAVESEGFRIPLDVEAGATGDLGFSPLTAEEITRVFDDNEMVYTQVSSNAWVLPYTSSNMENLEVALILNPDWVVFSTTILTLPEKVKEKDVYRDLLEYNFQVNQGKFAIDEGKIYFLIEVPIRLCDVQELLDNLSASAQVADGMYPVLLESLDLED